MSTANTAAQASLARHDATHGTITWRLMPLLLVCYLFAHLDRINIGFAKMQMSSDLHFSDTVYGFGAGLFMIACGRSSDRQRERRWHLCVPLLMSALGIAVGGLLVLRTRAAIINPQ